MRPDRQIERVYLHRAPVDFRRQMDGLCALVEHQMQMNPFSGALFLFTNKRRDKLNILLWDRTGFVVYYKRLEKDRFHWPTKSRDGVITLSGEQLHWLLEGYNVWQMKPHQTLHYSFAS